MCVISEQKKSRQCETRLSLCTVVHALFLVLPTELKPRDHLFLPHSLIFTSKITHLFQIVDTNGSISDLKWISVVWKQQVILGLLHFSDSTFHLSAVKVHLMGNSGIFRIPLPHIIGRGKDYVTSILNVICDFGLFKI